KIARQPAPTFHVDDDRVDRVGRGASHFLLLTVECAQGVGAKVPIDADVAFGLERLHRIADRVVVKRIVLVASDVEALAPRHDAAVFYSRLEKLAFRDIDAWLPRLRLGLGLRYDRTLAQLGELCLERLELLLRRRESIAETG